MQPHETILTEYRSDTRHFKRGAQVYDRTLGQQDRLTHNRLGRIDARWERSTRSILASRTALAGLGGVVGVAALNQLRLYAEGWRDVERRLQSIGVTSNAAQQGLVDLAIRTRSSIGGTAAAIQRFAKSTGDGIEITSRRVETLQKLLASAGASGTERASVSLQLGQALQSGVLSGDEFRSIRENAPVEFLDALAKAAGITRQELKKFAEDQKLTTDVVLSALDNLASTADAKFRALALSGEEAFSVLSTGLTAYVGQVDEALGATATINGAIASLGEYAAGAGESADTMARAIRIAGAVALATAGSRGVGALSGAFRKAAQGRRDDVTAAKAQHAASRQGMIDAQQELAAIQTRRRARQLEHQERVFQGRASVASATRLRAAIAAETKALDRVRGAKARAQVAATGLTAALGRLSLATRLTTGAIRAFNGVMAFFGGPVGLAITSLTLLVSLMATSKGGAERLDDAMASLSTTLGKLEGVNTSLASDYEALEGAQDRLAEAIRLGGDAAEDTATREVAAVNKRIKANELLRRELAVQARLRLSDARRELEQQRVEIEKSVRRQLFVDFTKTLDAQGVYGSARTAPAQEEIARLYKLSREELDVYIEAERERARQMVESGAATEDLTAFQKQLTGKFSEAIIAVEQMAAELEALVTPAALAGDGLDETAAAARKLAADAAAAQKGIAGLVAAIPELNKAAQVQAKLAEAAVNRDAALAGIDGQGLSGLERLEAEREVLELYAQATAEIDGTAEAARKADKALDAYLDQARIGALDARNQALAREEASYLGLVAALKAAKASQEELAAAEAAYHARRAQIKTDFDKRDDKSGTRAARAGERDLAAARDLLLENGHKALYIEAELNRERERLRDLLPELITLGLSRAEAEAVIGAELERTEDRLGRVKTASEEAAAAFAKNVLQDIRAADDLNDALDRISKRLLDLATDKAFDLLADQFANLGSGADGGAGGFLGTIFSSLFGGGVKAATGGLVQGPGTATSDSVPALLSDGEYVMRAAAVTPQSLPLLQALNRGAVVPRFAAGGQAGGRTGRAVGTAAPLINVEVHNHVSTAWVETRPAPDGKSLKVMIWNTVADGIIGGQFDRPNQDAYGLKRKARGA